MSVHYRAVQWNRQKKVYDRWLLLGVALYLAIFAAADLAAHPDSTVETLLIRGFGSASLLLLHVVLSIGPLCRLDKRFLPLLYNRRHMGVTVFVLALAHGGFSIVQFHALGDVNPLVSVLAALVFLFLMAATSHDFWLANLTAPVWKSLHMGVYLAYALVLMHVALGVLQSETHPALAALLGLGLLWLISLHLLAALRERGADVPLDVPTDDGFVDVGEASGIPNNRARIVTLGGERVAIFRYGGKISALSNVCQHQNGPLGEGAIVDGFVTCPWHGYQYVPDCGRSPEPFTERVPTFRARVADGRVYVHPEPLPPGTRVEPAVWEDPDA